MRRPKTKPAKKRKPKVSESQKAYRAQKRAARHSKPRRRRGDGGNDFWAEPDDIPMIDYGTEEE